MSYPSTLDTGATLVNTRTTGTAIPVSDHNDLANVAIALETKLGTGASVPATTGHVLTVTGAGATAWQSVPGTTATATYFNVKSYGAVGNGSADDTTAIQSAITAALSSSRGTGTVYFPAGTYKITSTLNCTSATVSSYGKGVVLRGDGHEASQIFKNSSFGPAVTWNGNGGPAGNNSQFGGMIDMTINGNATTGGLVQTNSAQQMFFRGCSFIGSNDIAWDFNTMQDSYFSQCTFNNCGSNTKYVIEMYGSNNGTSNMLWFDQIRVETYLKGAVGIYRGSGATGGGNNGFFWTQCKFENYPTVRGDHFFADSYTQQLVMSQIFISMGLYAGGYSTPSNGITFGDGSSGASFNQASFRDIFMNAGPTAGIGNSVVNINGGGNMVGPIVIDNVYSDATMTSGAVNINGATGADVRIGAVATNGGTLISGDGTGHAANTGTGTFTSGAATISTNQVTSSSRIFITPTSTSAASGIPYIFSKTAGTSFVVKSSNSSDANSFTWTIVN